MKNLNKIKIAEITVDTIDFIEQQVHQVTQDNNEKELLIDQVLQMLDDHYHTEIPINQDTINE